MVLYCIPFDRRTGGYRIYSEVDDDVLTDHDEVADGEPEYSGYSCRGKTRNLEPDTRPRN